ncbi:MAG: integrase, partial [Acidobacteria bacterium]
MFEVLISFLLSFRVYFRTRSDNQLEILALRHQFVVLQRKTPKPQTETDGSTFMGMAVSMLASMAFCAFDRETDNSRRLAPSRVRWYWTWKVRHGHVGRPSVAKETRELIRTLSRNNSIWGAPRIRSELLKLGIQISEASVAKYMVRHRKPPSQTWRTFLKNHAAQLASVDFFTVPTALFQVLFVFIVMRHDRRRIVHFNVTAHPTAEWTAHQILEAFPFDLAPKYLLRDRDRIYGHTFREQVAV